jgi:hypothetical protein
MLIAISVEAPKAGGSVLPGPVGGELPGGAETAWAALVCEELPAGFEAITLQR